MAPPLKISAGDEEVIDLHDEEVTIDLSNNDNGIAQKAETKAPEPAKPEPAKETAPVGKAAAPPPAAAGPTAGAAAGTPTGTQPAKAGSGGNGGLIAYLHTKNGKSMVVLLIAAIVVGALLFVPMGNESPEAVIDCSVTDPTDGQVILISARNSTDPDGRIKIYDWDYPDEEFVKLGKEERGGGDGHSWLRGYFKIKHTASTQDRTITVTVKDEMGADDTAEIIITVKPLLVTPEPEMIGDRASYTLKGDVTIQNNDGLFTIEQSDIVQIDDTVKVIYLTYSGTVDAFVDGESDPVEDGFLKNHTVYERRTLFEMQLDDGSYAETENNGDQPITGSINGKTFTWIYAPLDRAIKMELHVTDGDITAGDIIQEEKHITGKMVGYPHVQAEDNTLHVSDIGEGETLDVASHGDITVGSVEIDWLAVDIKAVKVEEIGYIPCIEFDINIVSIDGEDVDDPPIIKYWLADENPYPVRTYFKHTTQSDDGTSTTTENTKKMTDFTVGTTDLPDDESDFITSLNTDVWDKHDPDNWTAVASYSMMAPLVDPDKEGDHGFREHGGNIWQVEDAYDDAWAQDSDFREYMTNHPDAYNVLSLYNHTGKDKVWNMTFGEGGSDEFYNIEVSNQDGVTDDSEGAIDEDVELSQSLDDVPPVFAFETCVHRMYLLGDYDGYQHVHPELFESGSDDFSFENATVGQGILAVYPMPLSGASGEVTEYTVFAMNSERTMTVVVDAVSGQIMYYAEKRGFIDILDLSELLSTG